MERPHLTSGVQRYAHDKVFALLRATKAQCCPPSRPRLPTARALALRGCRMWQLEAGEGNLERNLCSSWEKMTAAEFSGWMKTTSPRWPAGWVLPLIYSLCHWQAGRYYRPEPCSLSAEQHYAGYMSLKCQRLRLFSFSLPSWPTAQDLWARLESYWEIPFFKRTKFCIPGESVREVKCTNWYWQSMRWDRDKTLHSTHNPLKTPHL